MSWDAYLYPAGADTTELGWLGDWNYTHNTNAMIVKVLETVGLQSERAWWDRPRTALAGAPGAAGTLDAAASSGTAWWKHLDGLSGDAGAKLLDLIVGGLLEAPALFRSMNPENGWGSYDGLLAVLVEMRDRSREHPSAVWAVSG